MMKRNFLTGFGAVAVALVTCTGSQAQDRPEFPDVPRDHWSYGVFTQCVRSGLVQEELAKAWLSYNFGERPSTRYEFAIGLAKLLDDEYALVQDKAPLQNQAKWLRFQDMREALRIEYRDELARLSGRLDGMSSSSLQPTLKPPPKLTTTLKFLNPIPVQENEPTQTQPEFPNVPRNHWSYTATVQVIWFSQMLGVDLDKIAPFNVWSPITLNRYQFAVFTARVLDGYSIPERAPAGRNAQEYEQLRLKVLDLIEALRSEYRDEIARINGRDPLSSGQRLNNLEQKVIPPPRLKTTLEFLKQTGPKVDGTAGQ